MHLKSRISATVVGLALLTGTDVVPAFARQEVTPSTPESMPSLKVGKSQPVSFSSADGSASRSKERPPDCLEAEQINKKDGKYVRVRNKCGRGMRFKAVIAFAPDLECKTIGRAYTLDYRFYSSRAARFDRLESC